MVDGKRAGEGRGAVIFFFWWVVVMDPARGRGAAVDFILRFRGMEERTTTHTQLSYRDVRRGGVSARIFLG